VRLSVLARFIAVRILSSFDPVAYDRATRAADTRLAFDDAGWKASHGIEDSMLVHSPLKEAFA
jgi:hypothetical protein